MKKTFYLTIALAATMSLQSVAQTETTATETPADMTSYIKNPSFESNGTTGWEVKNMSTQSNSVFSIKNGSYYTETWVSIGQRIADASVTQTLKDLPGGNYTLTANALHIQQTGSNNTNNSGAEQTGAYLFAGLSQVPVTAMKQYSVSFSILGTTGNIEIGLKAEGATGNYLCVDNFKLTYTGAVATTDYANELQKLVKQAQAYQNKGVQQSVAETLATAIEKAQTALQGTGTDEEGNIVYDPDTLAEAITLLQDGIAEAQASRALYDTLQERISYAKKVVQWWKDDEQKATILAMLESEIETAQKKLTDYTLSTAQLNTATKILNIKISATDKKVYCSVNGCGTDQQLQLPTSQWSYERSMQSKHWILFWEAGYGKSVPSSVESILATADKVFEYYANELKFITINQGVSKTDTYKMIIRLRYTDEWEASGSGIDNTIGLLTLSRWAYTSRGGQTVAHEIGHCFQYQTHCDNKDWNGWMYNWGSGNYNVFWEMCAQWQAYKYYPAMQFDNEWLSNTLNGLHKHPLCVDLRYNNYFIQDYFVHKHGMDIIGRLWNESKNPEDPLQAYMRLTMDEELSEAEKLNQLNDEMWEYGARMTTFDMDPIRSSGAGTIGKRNQTNLTKDSEGYWTPTVGDCIENFGHNAIRLNVVPAGNTVYAELIGQAGKSGYTAYNTTKAGWRFGFVALQRDGTRTYSEIGAATYDNPEKTIAFKYPANCSHLWLVVSGAPTDYWTRDWIDWDGVQGNKEQWPYKVKLYQTNVYGNANNNTLPAAIEEIQAEENQKTDNNVYTLTGQMVRQGDTSLEGLPHGVYIVNGKKILK